MKEEGERGGRRARLLGPSSFRPSSFRSRPPERVAAAVGGIAFFPAEVAVGHFLQVVLDVAVAGGGALVAAAQRDAAAFTAIHRADVLLFASGHAQRTLQVT